MHQNNECCENVINGKAVHTFGSRMHTIGKRTNDLMIKQVQGITPEQVDMFRKAIKEGKKAE